MEESIRYFAKAMGLQKRTSARRGGSISCYNAIGDPKARARGADHAGADGEDTGRDPNNGRRVGYGSNALAVLGQGGARQGVDGSRHADRAGQLEHAVQFRVLLGAYLKDTDAAIEMVGPVLSVMSAATHGHAKVDPDFDFIRDDPRLRRCWRRRKRSWLLAASKI